MRTARILVWALASGCSGGLGSQNPVPNDVSVDGASSADAGAGDGALASDGPLAGDGPLPNDAAGPPAALKPDCVAVGGNAATQLPQYAGTLPGTGDMTTAHNAKYLYVLTQWGFARAPLSTPTNPGPYHQIIIGQEGGSPAPGVFPILCDCHQGSNVMDVAEMPDGSSRMISDWQPYRQSTNSGLPAQLARTLGGANPTFGQQIDLGYNVDLGARVAAIYLPSTGKFFGYFPTDDDTAPVKMADLTSPTGSKNPPAIQPTFAIGWSSKNTSTMPPSRSGVLTRAAHVVTSTYDHSVLVGTTSSDLSLHLAEINETTGALTEVAAAPVLSRMPLGLDIAAVNDRIFIFSSEGNQGLKVYKFTPPGLLAPAGAIAGTFGRIAVRGVAPFPILFAHRTVSANESYVDVYDTRWLTEGSAPVRTAAVRHLGAPGVLFTDGFEVLVAGTSGYLYRQTYTTPEMSIRTDVLDLSCMQ
jgi:hypothetical protein